MLSQDSAYFEAAKKSAKYFKSLGMGPGTHILCNGAEIGGLTFSGEEGIEEKVYEFLLEAVPEIQRAVYYGQIGQVKIIQPGVYQTQWRDAGGVSAYKATHSLILKPPIRSLWEYFTHI